MSVTFDESEMSSKGKKKGNRDVTEEDVFQVCDFITTPPSAIYYFKFIHYINLNVIIFRLAESRSIGLTITQTWM